MSNSPTGLKRSASKPRVQEAPSLAAQEDHVVPPPEWDMEDDGTVPPEVLAALRDPNWTSDDLKDMRTNVVITTDIEAAIAAYEEEAQRWRVEREAAKNYRAAHRPANEDVPSASKSLAALCSREAMRSKTINNPKATFTFTTLVNACLNPEVQALGPDAIAESIVQVKNVKLDSVGLEDTDVLECLEVVQTLNLSNNLIRRLDGLEILTHLRVLIIPDNFVESLLPIAALELEMLDARRNRISTIEEDGVGVLPLTLKRCFLEGNPCTDVAGYVDLARQSCALLEVLDDDFFEPEERNDADDNEEDAATPAAAADDDGVANDNMDFDIEEEEARTAAFLAQQRRGGTQRPTSARYSLPVSDGVSSSVRTATDDLLRRYETELKTKLQSINRANDLAIAGLGSAGVAPAGDDAERSSRPSSRHARSDIASSRNAPSTLAEAVAYAAQRQHHPSGLLDSPRAASMPGTEPDAFEAGGAGSDSDEDNDMDDDMETGFNSHASASRPHAQAATRQTELQRELRFAMEHQRNVAINELNDRWDTGVDQLRRLRDVQEARHRSEEIREASAPAAGSAYNRAIEFLKGYSGERNLDKYRVARPGGGQQ